MNSAAAVLLIGDEDWPFSIPLIRTGQQWHFDPELGAIETHARRIGANELDAIEICMGYVSAQEEYAAQRSSGTGPSAYAQKIMSSPSGKEASINPVQPRNSSPKDSPWPTPVRGIASANHIMVIISACSRNKGRTHRAGLTGISPGAR